MGAFFFVSGMDHSMPKGSGIVMLFLLLLLLWLRLLFPLFVYVSFHSLSLSHSHSLTHCFSCSFYCCSFCAWLLVLFINLCARSLLICLLSICVLLSLSLFVYSFFTLCCNSFSFNFNWLFRCFFLAAPVKIHKIYPCKKNFFFFCRLFLGFPFDDDCAKILSIELSSNTNFSFAPLI